MGVEVKNDIEDARVLSKALHLAKDGQVNVPVFNEYVEQIKELRIIEQVQTLIDSTDEYRVAYGNIISIKGVGQIAVMRKIILTAHSLYKNNRKYDEDFNYQEAVRV